MDRDREARQHRRSREEWSGSRRAPRTCRRRWTQAWRTYGWPSTTESVRVATTGGPGPPVHGRQQPSAAAGLPERTALLSTTERPLHPAQFDGHGAHRERERAPAGSPDVRSDDYLVWDGDVQIGVTDTFQQTATRHGLDWNPGVDTSSTFDNLEIRNNGTPVTPPGVPGNPSPSNTATSVATNATMSWSATGATSYDVAFGTVNPPPPVTIAQSGTTYRSPPPMATSTTYFWQVTARSAGGSTAADCRYGVSRPRRRMCRVRLVRRP